LLKIQALEEAEESEWKVQTPLVAFVQKPKLKK
jgi:hypothetical protein